MSSNIFVNLNGIDVNVLNIAYLGFPIPYYFIDAEYDMKYSLSLNKPTFVFNNKRYVIHDNNERENDLYDNRDMYLKKYCFKIHLKVHTLLSDWYDTIEAAENAKNCFKEEINNIIREYGHLLLDDGIKRINI